MFKLVSVMFLNSKQSYDYLCQLEEVSIGDYVRVDTPRGEQVVQVVRVFEAEEQGLELPLDRYRYIKGRATGPVPESEALPDKYFVTVIFNATSYQYSYACPDESIGAGDYVIVTAAGVQKPAKVVNGFRSCILQYRPIERRATEQEIKECVYSFEQDQKIIDPDAYKRFLRHWRDYTVEIDEDAWAMIYYAKAWLPEYKHEDYFVYEDLSIVKGDVVELETPLGTTTAVVKRVYFDLYGHSLDTESPYLCCCRRILRKLQDNPNTEERLAEVEKVARRIIKLKAKASEMEEKAWESYIEESKSSEELSQEAREALMAGAARAAATAGDSDDFEEALKHSTFYAWHPENDYYRRFKKDSKEYDPNRIVDENGHVLDGKWLAEHERNKGPGVYDSRGFAKDPEYEFYLKYNDLDSYFGEEEE